MLLSIGKKAEKRADDAVSVLSDCHGRIRKFAALACSVGERLDAPAGEIQEVCAAVERYFRVALPLHVEDEELSVEPRLIGASPEVDRALSLMQEQHGEHRALVRALLAACAALRDAPHDKGKGDGLVAVGTALRNAFKEHLVMEETVIFPAIRALSVDVQQAIWAEVRERRRAL